MASLEQQVSAHLSADPLTVTRTRQGGSTGRPAYARVLQEAAESEASLVALHTLLQAVDTRMEKVVAAAEKKEGLDRNADRRSILDQTRKLLGAAARAAAL